MRWVVRIEREDDGSESDVIRIERSRMEDAAGLGLTLEDGKRIMALLQKRVFGRSTTRALPVESPMQCLCANSRDQGPPAAGDRHNLWTSPRRCTTL